MAIENKRVIDLANESTSLAGDEYVLLDSDNTGTTKYRLSRLSGQIESVDEAVQAEAIARQNADEELEQDVSDLKDDLDEQIGINTNRSTGWEQGFWYTPPSTTRQDYIRSKASIPVVEGDVVTVDMNGYVGTEVQFNYFDGDTYSGRTTVRQANFANGVALFNVPSGVPNVRINIYSGGSSIHIDPADYADVKVYINPTITVKEQLSNLNTKIPIPFEVGLITYGNNGFYYPNEQTTRRIRRGTFMRAPPVFRLHPRCRRPALPADPRVSPCRACRPRHRGRSRYASCGAASHRPGRTGPCVH